VSPTRRAPARSRAALACALALGAPGCGPAPRDVVLISLDSVRADALTFDDAAAAPNLTRLATRGTVFTRAYSGTSWTLPAHAQLFTGAPPALHGVQYDDLALDPEMPTLPELLRGAGYFTAGFWTGWFLAGEYGFERGFHVYENAMTGGLRLQTEYERALRRGDLDLARRLLDGREHLGHQDVTSARVAERAAALLERVDADEPLFLFAHLFDPHYDYVPPAPWDTRFDPDYDGDFDGRDFYTDPRVFDPSRTPPTRLGPRDVQHLFALYRGEIGWTDAQLGRLFDALREAGRLQRSLVVVTSDHGDEFFEHGGRGHRHTLYEELVHVPLLMVAPRGGERGGPARVDALVGLSDVAPTVLEFAGLAPPPHAQGRSLLSALAGAPLASEPQLATLALVGPVGERERAYLLQDSLRGEDFKLIRTLVVDRDDRARTRAVRWFDLAQDPRERSPVTDVADPRVRAAVEELDRRLLRLRAAWEALERSPAEARTTRVQEVFAGELEALGYAGEDGGTLSSPTLGLPWGLGPHPPPLPPR